MSNTSLVSDNMYLLLSTPHIDRGAFRGEVQRLLDSFVETEKAPDLDFARTAALAFDRIGRQSSREAHLRRR